MKKSLINFGIDSSTHILSIYNVSEEYFEDASNDIKLNIINIFNTNVKCMQKTVWTKQVSLGTSYENK